jgi:glycosyltransferase involved in cell wall biosynthesis
MRWLIVAGDFTPLGGMDAANHALARFLAARGEVHLVTHRAWPDLVALPSVTVHRVWRPLGRNLLGSVLLARAGRYWWRRLRSSGIRVVVNGGNCNIGGANWVHYLHAADGGDCVGSVGSRLRRIKTAVARRRDLRAERHALHAAEVVICNSQRTRRDVIDRIGVHPDRVRVVYYGGDSVRFSLVGPGERDAAREALSQPGDRPLVGFIGALGDRRKAFDTLFAAWRELCGSATWDADLIVVGEGAERSAWERRTRRAGLADRIRFAGFRTDVPQILAALDALVHPARYEAYGLSVREAISRGIPAIVSASAGVAEHYPPQFNGLLIADSNDPRELATRLLAWRERMAATRAAIVPLSDTLRQRTWDVMAGEIADCVVHP